VIELIVRGPVPVLVSFTAMAALVVVTIWPLKATFVWSNPIPGTEVDPVPVRFTLNTSGVVSPPFETTAVITSVADSAAATDGVNVTLTVHELPAATPLGLHPSEDFAKSVLAAGDTPVTTMLVNVIGDAVLFVKRNGCGALVTLNGWIPKLNGEGVTVKEGISVSFATKASLVPFSPATSGATGVPATGIFVE